MKDNAIVPYKYSVDDINYITPEAHEKAYKRTITEINNAWNKCSFLDDSGRVWVSVERIHSILRTDKGGGKYYIQEIESEAKRVVNNKTYIMGSSLGELIDTLIQKSGEGTRGRYLRYSEDLYKAIRDSETAKNLRIEFSNELAKNRRGLKKERIKRYNIKLDELTGVKLLKRTCEFSHIRSFAIFPEHGDNLENGLIINKDIHTIITNAAVNDEEELFELCKANNWDTSWYDKFKEYFDI